MNKAKEIELFHLIEELMYSVADDNTPCECGLYCPYYDDKNPDAYCVNSNCAQGMVDYIKELF